MKVFATMLTLALLEGCSTAPIASVDNRMDFGAGTAVRLPVESLLDQRFATVVRQRYDFSCGSAALATLLRFHYGEAQDETTVFTGMWRDGDQAQIRRLGFSLLDMKRYLAARNLSADGFRVSLDDMAKARLPGIALINFNGYRHFVVVKALEGRSILLGDPALGLRWIDRAAFSRQWNGVFFVLNDRQPIGRAHFGQASDLVHAPRALFPRFAEPLSLSGLELLRPGVNSF
jgi:uncharacterized protein